MNLLLWLAIVGIAYTAVFIGYRRLTTRSMDHASDISSDAFNKDKNSQNGFDIIYEDTSQPDLDAAKKKLIASFRSIQQMQTSKTAILKDQRYQEFPVTEESKDDDADEVNSGSMIRKIANENKQQGEKTEGKESEAKEEPGESSANNETEPDPLIENSEVYKKFNFKMRDQ